MSGGRKGLRPHRAQDRDAPLIKPDFQPFKLLDWMQNLVLSALIGLLRILPYRWRVPFSGWLMRRVIAPIAGYPARVRTNLALIWPDLTTARVEEIVWAVCDNAGRTLAELYSPNKFKALVADAHVLGAGLDPILAAQAQGRGVLLISGHFGNHDIARAVLASKGMAVAALYRPQSNPYFDKHFAATSAPYQSLCLPGVGAVSLKWLPICARVAW